MERVRPDHLFEGTRTDNAADRDSKGRTATGARHGSRTKPGSLPKGDKHWRSTKPHLAAVGECHGHAKLTYAKVGRMKEMREEGMTYAQIAAEFGVSRRTASRAIKGKTWDQGPTIVLPKV